MFDEVSGSFDFNFPYSPHLGISCNQNFVLLVFINVILCDLVRNFHSICFFIAFAL